MKVLQVPRKIYFKRGCTPVALREMHEVYGLQKALLITSPDLYSKGLLDPVNQCLKNSGLHTAEFFTVIENPTIENVKTGLQKMDEFEPDVIIALGDGKTMSAAKIMWLLYENRDADIAALAAGTAAYPQMGTKAELVLMPATSGSGCECSPYAEIVDEKTGKKLCLNSFNLLPLMAVIDPDVTAGLTASEIKQGGLEALKNAIAAAVVPDVNDYAQGFAREAAAAVFQNLEVAMEGAATQPVACENMANAAANAGIAYACAVQGAVQPDEGVTIKELISSASDKTVLLDLAHDCGLTGSTEYNTEMNLIAECEKMANL